ncbi:MAG: hypothetical protein ACRDLN_02175 [Solirubrobacteraceae bacterium]
MTAIAVGSTVAVIALIGLAVGLLVLAVVILLLHGTLTPLRKILEDVRSAQTAPMLKTGVKGTDQLDRTRRLADAVPGPAVAYMQKLGLPVDTERRPDVFPEPGRPTVNAGWR